MKSRISNELQTGKAAEHLVCADLILQGYSAFLTDQGLPYDVVVDTPLGLRRIQVKAATKPWLKQGHRLVYTFGTRRAKKGDRPVALGEVDFYAFVLLDVRKIGYLTAAQMEGSKGNVLQCIEFVSEAIYTRPSKGKVRRVIEDFAAFPVSE